MKEDVIILNGTDAEVQKMAENMEERRKKAKLSKVCLSLQEIIIIIIIIIMMMI